MKLLLLSILLLYINPRPPPSAARMTIDSRHALGLAQAAQRTHLSLHEEIFCLLGLAQRDSTYVVLAVVRPDQRTEIRRVGTLMVTSVFSRTCPPGTIADLHTHPFSSNAPSWIDAEGWTQNRKYTLHLIAFVQNDFNKIGFAAYDYSDPNRPRGLREGWLITQHQEAQ